MRILKISKVHTFMAGIMMMAIILCCSSQVKGAQDGEFTYSATYYAQNTGYTGNLATTIYDNRDTVQAATKSTGYDPSAAETYASKWNRTFEVLGTTNTLQIIAITTPAAILSYYTGDELDITELEVTGTYSDGSTKAESITDENVTGFNSAVAVADQVLTITVGTKTTTYNVQILNEIVNPDYMYTITAGEAQITKYTGAGGVVTIPSILGGVPVTSIGDCAFVDCSGLTTVSIPQSITSIGDVTFANCTGLTSINIPEDVTSIGNGVFTDCSSLTAICIPQGVTSIGSQAFWGCTSLSNISIPGEVARIDNGAFSYCTDLTIIQVDVDNLNYSSINGVLYNKAGTILIACPGGLASISIPEGVKSIGFEAFRGCAELTTVSILEGVTSIGAAAFSGCTGLTSISVPQGVTYIGDQAFNNCTSLTTVHIPQEVTSIGNGTFANCNSLTAIQVDVDNLKYSSINGVLYNKEGSILIACPGGLTNMSIPLGVTNIGDMAFSGCTGITAISIPREITSIGEYAFSICTGLTSIRFYSSTTTIDDNEYTIPFATKIIGFDLSTAKDYALKYNRTFEVMGYSATSLVQIGTNPEYGDSAGIFVGLKDVKNTLGNLMPDAKLAGYQIDVNYDHTQAKLFGIVDEAHSENFTVNNVINPDKTRVADVVTQGTNSFEKLFFVPLALTGNSSNTTSLTIRFNSLSDINWNDIIIPDVTLTFKRGKIANEASQKPLRIVDAVAGLQYLAKIVDAGLEPGKVNIVNMASISQPEAGATSIKPSVKNVIALMQNLVGLRDDSFQLVTQ